MISSIGIRQAITILFVSVFLIICGCVNSGWAGTELDKWKATSDKYMKTNADAGEKSIYDSLKKKQYDEAIKKCEKLRAIRPDDNDVYLLEGYAYYKKKNFLSSNDRFSHIIDSDKSRGDAYLFRGFNYLWLNKPKEALNDINKALDNKQTPDQALKLYRGLGSEQTNTENIKELIHREKASAHHRLGEFQPAMESVNKAMEYNSNSGRLYNLRGQLNFSQQKYNQSYKDLEKSVKIFPNNSQAWNTMGMINFLNGNYIDALSQYQKARELNPKNLSILINMSLSYWLQGNQVKAFETMEKVLRKKPYYVTFYHFAYFHHLNGDQDKALSNFKKAQELKPDILKIRATAINRAPISSPTRNFYQDQLKTAKKYIETGKTPTALANENRAPTIEITSIILEPDPVPVNKPFDIRVKFKVDIPGSTKDNLPILFYFKISQNNEVLHEENPKTISAGNAKTESWVEHMNPVPAKGIYTINAYIKYKELLAEKRIELIIQ